MGQKSKLWTKDFIILTISSFFISIGFFILLTTTSVYVMDEYGASQKSAGLAAGIFVIGSLVSRIIVGKYIEIIGRKKLLYIGFLLFGIVTIVYLFVHQLTLYILIRFIHGLTYGVGHSVLSTAAMDLIPSDRRGEGTSYFTLSFTLATAIGPFFGILVLENASMNLLFMICAALALVSFLISLLAKIPKANLSKEQLEELKEFKITNFIELSAVPISFVAAIMAFAYSASLSFLSAYSIEINLTVAASFFFIVSSAFTLIARPLTGRIFDIKGENTVIYPSIILFAISYFVLSQANNGFFLLLAAALIGSSYGTVTACAQAIGIRQSPKHRIGLATSTFLVFMNAGIGIGPYLQGMIIPYIGYRGMYLSLAIVITSGMLFYYYLHGKNQYKRKEVKFSQASYKN